jgi:uncharacterized protein
MEQDAVAALVWTVISVLWMVYSLKSDPGNFRLNNTSNSLIILAVLALTLIPFQAAFEEILFSGYLMQGFAVLARNRWVPIIFTSVLFGLMHGLNPEVQQYGFMTMMPQYIFFGVVFAVLTMFDDGIEMAIGAHAANNIFLSVMVTHDDMALQTPALYEQIEIHPWKEFGGLIAMSVIFLGNNGSCVPLERFAQALCEDKGSRGDNRFVRCRRCRLTGRTCNRPIFPLFRR